MSPFDRTFFGFVLALCLVMPCQVFAQNAGDASIEIAGEMQQWHKITLTLDGPFARETDTDPNPFTDVNLLVTFTHEQSKAAYTVPGYFAGDRNAAETSATEGNQWRVHFAPDRTGRWSYRVVFLSQPGIALLTSEELKEVRPRPTPLKGHGSTGDFTIVESDKTGRDFRAHGRLEYVDKRYLRFAGSGEYFLKAGADAPETLLAYQDFDGTQANKKNSPLKSYQPHLQDWRRGDPTWQGGKGKGLIGAINYLSSTGCNAFSFLPYNAGGDGDNVWPFVEREDKMHYDCSKLDQWGIVFDHATAKGMYLHFKLQETEIDDNRKGKNTATVWAALDGGDLGPERRLYCRELIARFGHNLALNWNLGEENTQSTKQQRDMANYILAMDPYGHHIVLHTYPNQQDKVYGALLGEDSVLTGVSLQNSNVRDCHAHTLKWVERSQKSGKPWVVAFDEPGDASFGTPPDPDYPGMDKANNKGPTIHDVRKHALWGTLMAGGAGVEYYFGYKLPQNDLNCEDWRSREQTWKYSSIALDFFHDNKIPFWDMQSRDQLVVAGKGSKAHCLAQEGKMYLVYTHETAGFDLNLEGQDGAFDVFLFNPRQGGELVPRPAIEAGRKVKFNQFIKSNKASDWVVLFIKQ